MDHDDFRMGYRGIYTVFAKETFSSSDEDMTQVHQFVKLLKI